MTAKKGNQLWKLALKHGRDKKLTPDELLKAAEKYFQFIEDNPLKEERLAHEDGSPCTIDINKMRAMTIQGLCLSVGITDDTWANYKAHKDYKWECEIIAKVIWEQKLTGAAAGMLNAVIISRELGLKEKTDLSSEDGTMTPKGFNDFYTDKGNHNG